MNEERASKALRLMLGSDNPGEVMAARDAFIRLMGGDLHAVADRFFSRTPSPQPASSYRPAQRAKTAEEEADAEAIKEARELAFKILAAAFGDPSVHLTPNEQRFLHQMQNTKWPPTPKQRAWLFIISDKVFCEA